MSSLAWAFVLLAGLACTHALGTQTTIENYPSLAQVEYRTLNTWSQQCVGIILTNYHLVSAASCYQDIIPNRRIRAGSGVRNTGGYVAEISNRFNHPSYGANGDDGDICIIRLLTSLVLGPTIGAGSIVPQDYYITQNQRVSLVGWGSTAEGGVIGNNYLYELGVITQNTNECLAKYQSYDYPRIISENMLCVGLEATGGRDLDGRDAGAPLFYYDALAGLVSFGSSRGRDEVPVVATSISSYTNWIIEHAQ